MATRNGCFINVDAPHRLTAWVTGGMVLAVLSGCVTSPVYTLPAAKPDQTSCSQAMTPSDTLIGVAISGGGVEPPCLERPAWKRWRRCKSGPRPIPCWKTSR